MRDDNDIFSFDEFRREDGTIDLQQLLLELASELPVEAIPSATLPLYSIEQFQRVNSRQVASTAIVFATALAGLQGAIQELGSRVRALENRDA